MFTRTLAVLAVFALASVAKADDAKDARAKLDDYLKSIEGAAAGRITALTVDGETATFPDHVLFSQVIPLYPVAHIPPEPLKTANVFAVPKKKDAKVVLITDTKQLEKFFMENARAVKSSETAEETVKAWLRGISELSQDGYFKLTVKAGVGTASGATVTQSGDVTVDPGNGDKGSITAKLTFKDGKLATTETKVDLMAGMRPRCQATKLLDPDPIVRAMAEDSLRVMGSSAADYLAEQYAKASPALREAIDRVRGMSKAEGR